MEQAFWAVLKFYTNWLIELSNLISLLYRSICCQNACAVIHSINLHICNVYRIDRAIKYCLLIHVFVVILHGVSVTNFPHMYYLQESIYIL